MKKVRVTITKVLEEYWGGAVEFMEETVDEGTSDADAFEMFIEVMKEDIGAVVEGATWTLEVVEDDATSLAEMYADLRPALLYIRNSNGYMTMDEFSEVHGEAALQMIIYPDQLATLNDRRGLTLTADGNKVLDAGEVEA